MTDCELQMLIEIEELKEENKKLKKSLRKRKIDLENTARQLCKYVVTPAHCGDQIPASKSRSIASCINVKVPGNMTKR